ncbi:MAG: SDR family oxidoreductase [Treponema sp.]|nr:SDR family oxidoreductase [Treponema sp.]
MNAAIIGSNGYIGKHLAKYLLEKNWEIYGYDILNENSVDGVKYKKLEIKEKKDAEEINLNVDYIFYFSGITGTSRAYDDYELFIDTNEKVLLHLLNRMRNEKRKNRIIFPSTRLVYKGIENTPLNEESEKEFKTIYSLNKWFGENIIRQYSEYFKIKYNIFRICVPYGNSFNENYSYGTIGFILNSAKERNEISIYGSGEQKRTFSHIYDICNQIYYSIIDENTENQIFNIHGETYSIIDIAKKIGKKYNAVVKNNDWPELEEKMESGDTIFDSSKIIKSINYKQINYFDAWLDNLT